MERQVGASDGNGHCNRRVNRVEDRQEIGLFPEGWVLTPKPWNRGNRLRKKRNRVGKNKTQSVGDVRKKETQSVADGQEACGVRPKKRSHMTSSHVAISKDPCCVHFPITYRIPYSRKWTKWTRRLVWALNFICKQSRQYGYTVNGMVD